MTAIRGYPSQQKLERTKIQFVTVEPVHKEQNGASVVAHQYVFEVGTDIAEAGSDNGKIVATSSAVIEGDVLLLTSGDHQGKELKVVLVDGDDIYLSEDLPSAIAAGTTFTILRHKYPAVESDGRVKISGSFSTTEEAVAADGDPLPAKVKVAGGYDGSAVQALKTDADGELQVDVVSSALPTGAATETTLDAAKTNLDDIAATTNPLNGARVANRGIVIGFVNAANTTVFPVQGDSFSRIKVGAAITDSAGLNAANIVSNRLAVDGSGVVQPISNAALTSLDGKITKADTDTVTVVSSALPTGAATEATLSSLSTDLGTLAGVVSGSEAQVDVKSIEGVIDANNSTSTPLAIGATYTGAWTDLKDFNAVNLGVYANQDSAVDGLKIQYSADGVSVHHEHLWTYSAASGGTGYQLSAEFRYFRVQYVNGAAAQTSFELVSNLKPTALFPSSYRASRVFTDESQVILTKGVIVGKTTAGGGAYESVKVNPSGALTVEADVTSSVLPTGAATEATLATLATEATVATLATEATVSTLATEATAASIDGKLPATLGQKTMANSLAVVLASDQSAIPVTGSFTAGALSVVDLVDGDILDTSVVNIPGSASSPVEVVASLAANVKMLQLLDTTGAFLGLYEGASGSEVLKLVIGPGSDQTIEHSISAGARVSLKRLDGTAAVASGIVAINFLG